MPLDNTIGAVLESKGRLICAVAPGTSVFDALSIMAEQDIGAVLVMDGDRLRGVLSERDYARKGDPLGKVLAGYAGGGDHVRTRRCHLHHHGR